MLNFVRPTPLTDRVYEYALTVGLREPDALRALREETGRLAEGEWQIAPEQGPLLALLVKLMGATKCLEVGTFTGYSALWVASALPAGGQVVCCDVNPTYAEIARRHWAAAGLADRIELRLAPALDTLTRLRAGGADGTFDFAFIDADKSNYDAYFEAALALLRPGGLVAIDNTLWDGKPADDAITDADTAAIRALNAKLHADTRIDLCFLPFADGLTLGLKR
ncbi:O-methyltransferase [Urbifossiella limnaea]|uniref:O-methyltransferase/MSMEI_4947 n=1 Tax=Urbifossiella limnaea TaxID=2528023 RepID=A0A517XZ83_9BACT|nr:class I SAM-dependent methyltransferase [Urbifossiella limnaea]QDU22811.1 Putative O-methyltransferase/MSMEI_4947 [Urbifossiella limnaea]